MKSPLPSLLEMLHHWVSVHRKCDCVIESLQVLCALMVSAGHNQSSAGWIYFQQEHGERLPIIVLARREQPLSTFKVGSWRGLYPCWSGAAKLAMRAFINGLVAPKTLDLCLIFKAEHIVPKKDNLWLTLWLAPWDNTVNRWLLETIPLTSKSYLKTCLNRISSRWK